MVATRTVLVLSALFALPSLASEAPAPPAPATAAPTPATAAKKAPPKAPAGAANMVVTKDPETGELRPATAAEREKLLGRKALAAPEHTVVTLPDGSVMVELGEADMSYAVATRGADGKIVQSCVHGKEAAKAATTEKVAPAAATPAPAAPATDR